MAINEKRYGYYQHLRDVRPVYVRLGEWMGKPQNSFIVFLFMILPFYFMPGSRNFADLIFGFILLYFWWLKKESAFFLLKCRCIPS